MGACTCVDVFTLSTPAAVFAHVWHKKHARTDADTHACPGFPCPGSPQEPTYLHRPRGSVTATGLMPCGDPTGAQPGPIPFPKSILGGKSRRLQGAAIPTLSKYQLSPPTPIRPPALPICRGSPTDHGHSHTRAGATQKNQAPQLELTRSTQCHRPVPMAVPGAA